MNASHKRRIRTSLRAVEMGKQLPKKLTVSKNRFQVGNCLHSRLPGVNEDQESGRTIR